MSDPVTSTRDPGDAKAWFYLDNRDDIEAWKALRPEGRQLLDKSLVGLEASVEELATELGVEAVTGDLEAGSFPRLGLRRPTWRGTGDSEVAVVIEWERSRLLTPGSNEWPYVGVRTRGDGWEGSERQKYQEALKPVRARLGGKASRPFPFWAYVSAESPLSPERVAHLCLTRFRELWDLASPVLDTLEHDRSAAPTGEI